LINSQAKRTGWRSRQKVDAKRVKVLYWACANFFQTTQGRYLYPKTLSRLRQIQDLLKNKYLNILKLRYTDSIFPFCRILLPEASSNLPAARQLRMCVVILDSNHDVYQANTHISLRVHSWRFL
jgi:hypothetical protein